MHRQFSLAASVAALCLLPGVAFSAPQVVASVKPIHSLVASVMKGVGEPALIVEGGASPHTYSMKPSNARALESADVVFWVGSGLEAFLEKPLKALAGDAKVVELEDVDGLRKLPFREGGAFEAHDHGEEEHAHGSHDDHDHAGHDHGHEAHAEDSGHDHHEGDGHSHGGSDMHLWLDPNNASVMAKAIAETLSEADPDNAATYAENLKALEAELEALDDEIRNTLAPTAGKRAVVFHDAYQYFETHYGLRIAGSITVSPETMPGAERLSEIKAKIAELDVACVFAEPQFDTRLVEVVTAGTNAKIGTLDPEGATFEPGAGLYSDLMRKLATSSAECMG